MPDSEMGKMDFPGAIKALKDAGFTREAAVLQRLAENMHSRPLAESSDYER